MNAIDLMLAVAAGIGILAALLHAVVGVKRRPLDRTRLAFACAALAAAVGALAVLAMHSAGDLDSYIAVTKWAFVPASIGWTVASVWLVAFYTRVQPRLFLATLTVGFTILLIADLVLPTGLLHDGRGRLVQIEALGGDIMIITGSSPHILHRVTEVLTVVAFLFLCYAVFRVYRRSEPSKAGYLGVVTVILAAAALVDNLIEHSPTATLSTLYLTQMCFAVVIVAVSLILQLESLRQQRELQLYRTQMDDLVKERVSELDEAYALLELEAGERRVTEEALRRREEELDALQRMAGVLAGRATLAEALDEATEAIAGLFKARYARVRLVTVGDPGDAAAAGADDEARPLTSLDLAVSAAAVHAGVMIAADVVTWPGLPADVRAQAASEGFGHLLATPLRATSGPAGALIIARDAGGGPFSPEEQQLARTAGEALTAVIEIDRLYRQAQRQAAAEERQALARDLHDAVTQSIYSATLIAEALPAVWQRDPAEGAQNLERLRRLVRAALAEMRTLLFELRPAALSSAPLDTLFERLGDALGGQIDIVVDTHVDPALDLPPDVKIVFYRVTQEAFSNIAKHARASRVTARVLAGDGVATLTVQDDGRGFDPDAVPSGGHMGLRIMHERLARIAGTLTVRSAPGVGTTITAAWPSTASAERPLERMGA